MTVSQTTSAPAPAVARRPVVAVYRDDLLTTSERFVVEPLLHLRRFDPLLVGTRRVSGHELAVPSLVLTRGRGPSSRLRVAAYRSLGGVGLHRRLARHAPALVHAHFGLDGLQALPLARRLRVPLVTTFHGYDVLTADDTLAAASYRGRRYVARRPELADQGALFLPVSDFLRSELLAQGFPEARVRRHYLGVDTDFFAPLGQPRRGLLFVGRLVAAKGAGHVIEAAAAAAHQHPGLTLTVIGDGPERPSLEARARTLGLRAVFLGSQPRAVVREHLAGAALACSGSHRQADGWREAFGLTTIEAQAMAVPVVGYRSGGVGEAVEDGVTGALVAEGDVRGLAQVMTHLLGDPATCERMGRLGRARTLAHFDMARQAGALEDMYDELVAR